MIFFTIVPTTQAADSQGLNYLSSKSEYIYNHPGQTIIPYPWNPITSTKVLPFNYTIPAIPGNNLSIRASPDEFASTSFVINAQKDISGIAIEIHDLHDTKGNTIPVDAINVRLVKVWYQAGDEDIGGPNVPRSVLTPELLIKDDALIQVDYINRTNFVRVTINGSQQYIDISSPTAIFPSNAEIYDAASLQPFSLKTNENKQIWLTVHVPNNTPAGDYYGNIAITAPSTSPVLMNLSITVLPFYLEPAPVRYILYYPGKLKTTPVTEIGSDWKIAEQYAKELQNMKDHGISYPQLYQPDYQPDDDLLDTALSIRVASGMPLDRIYLGEWNAHLGNATDAAGLTKVAKLVKNWRNHTTAYGFGATYFLGMDEVRGGLLLSQRDAWQVVHDNGGKIVATSYDTTDPIELTGDILDAANIGTKINATAASVMHRYGHEIYLYNQPQVGIENPAIYRKNYGFTLWSSGYDGAMNFAYQYGFGNNIWNDFDSGHVRDHVFAYPTSDGVIDTIQWEGWSEGVDDTRYVATLMKKEGSDTSARAIVSGSLSKGEDMQTIREKVIDRILISSKITKEQLNIDVFNDVWNLSNNFKFGKIARSP